VGLGCLGQRERLPRVRERERGGLTCCAIADGQSNDSWEQAIVRMGIVKHSLLIYTKPARTANVCSIDAVSMATNLFAQRRSSLLRRIGQRAWFCS
jgi:hypothetical protein